MSPPLLAHGIALTAGTVVQALAGLGTQIMLMRLLLPEDFGRFAVVFAGCGLVQTILSLRLNVLIIRLPEQDHQTAALYQAALVWETVAAALVTLVWLLLADLLSLPVLTLVAALTIGQWVNQALAFYERRMDYRRITLVETGSQLAGHAIALALVFSGAGSLSLYLRELAAICCRLAGFAAIGALPRPVWRRPTLADWPTLWQHSRGIWSEGLLEGAFARLIILISGGLAGLHGAGLFAQSQRLAMLPHQFLSPVISRMSITLFSRTDQIAKRNQLLLRLGLGTALLMLPGIAVIWLWAPLLVPWLFGDNWREAGLVLRAMIGLVLFLSLFDLLRSFCYAHGWVRPILWGRAAQIAAFVLPTMVLGFGDTLGLAWSLSTAHAVGFLLVAVLTWRLVKGAGKER